MRLRNSFVTLAAAFALGAGEARAALPYAESFDAVAAPALPAGWSSVAAGAQSNWVTTTTLPDTAPNAAFAPNVPARGTAALLSAPLAIDSPSAQLSFRLAYNLEDTFDGLVLEIKIGPGEFTDILDAGGEFVSGGYVTNLSQCCSNPLPNRPAWSGLSGGTTNVPAYRTVVAKLPASAGGQMIQLRWLLGCDVSETAGGAAGVWVDGININVPPPVAPTAVTVAAGPVGASSATLNGQVNPGRAPTSVYFDHGASPAYGQRTATNVLPAGNFPVAVAASISGLTLGQTYHYRVVAMNSEGTATGSNVAFTTVPSAPSAITLAASDIAFGSAALNATVNPNGSVAGAFFQFGFDTGYGFETVATNLGGGASPVTIRQALAGLAPGATYHFRVVATNALGTNAGADFTFSTPPAFTNINAGLPGALRGSVSWADCDNDGLLDLLVLGLSGTNRITQLFRNNGDGSFSVNTNAVLPGVVNGAAAWGDYDRDGRLDLALTGSTNGAAIGALARLFRNQGDGTFSNIAVFPGLHYSAMAWGDYDNDGASDLLLAGQDTNGLPLTQLFRNAGGGAFIAEANAVLPALAFGSAAWGDYDNDGRLDLLLTGQESGGAPVARVYRNTGGGTFANHPGANLPGVSLGGAAWADFDSDGRLDLALAGTTNGLADGALARIYRNGVGGVFSNVNAALPAVFNAALAWGDADNDGLPDLLLAGTTNGLANGAVSQVFRGAGGGAFENLFAPLPGVYLCATAWGDYDADGRLDLALSGAPDFGLEEITQVFHNNLILTNSRPSAPSGLADSVTNNSVVLTWSAAADGETTNSAGLTYNVRLGRGPGAADVLAPQANGSTGLRRLPAAGNAQHRGVLALTNLAPGTYYWSVQAVDPAFAGSPFATENTFTITNAPPLAATLAPLSVGTNDATLAGSVTPNAPDTRAWFDFGLTTAYGSRTAVTNVGGGTNAIAVHLMATGLALGATYHCRLVASNSAGQGFGSNRTFTTLGPPVVETLAANGVSAANATLNATVNPGFSATTAFFEWGTSTNYGNTTAITNVGAGGAAVSVRAVLAGLTPGSNYHFRIVATNLAGVARGADEQFSILFTNLPAGIPPVSLGAVAWGDADGDGALDLLITGSTNGTASGAITRVYRNQGGGVFSNLNVALPGLMNSAAAWSDFDNDGDLDLLLAGTTNGAPAGALARVYRNNNAGAFADAGVTLPGVFGGAVAWADFDNDGRPDVLLTGYEPARAGGFADVFLNRGNDGFVPLGAGFTGVYGSLTGGSSAAVADDFDQDGWMDVVVNGSTNGQAGGASTRLYLNRGAAGFAHETNAMFPGVFSGALAAGDENGDGYPDLLVAGTTNGLASGAIAQVFRNTGGGLFNLASSLTGVMGSLGGAGNAAAAWADHDNDGRLDVLLCGTPTGAAADTVSRVYRNLGGAFSALDLGLPGVANGASAAWGDFDNDGRLDAALAGVGAAGRLFQVLRSLVPIANVTPSAPTNLAAVVVNNGAALSWNAAGDAQTPSSALTHNLRVGTAPGGLDIVSPQARLTDGRRRVPQPGNARSATAALLTNLPLGTFHWSVQSVDAAFAGSAFALEGSFVVSNAPPSVSTLAADGVISTGAVLHASITPNALATVAWFEFGVTPALGSATTATNVGSGVSAVPVSAEISGLLAGATHYFRAVASNSAGRVAGPVRTFVTAGAPFVMTLPAENIGATNATLRGATTPNQLPTTAWFEWGTNSGYGQIIAVTNIGNGGSAVSVTAVLAGLLPGVVYYYRLAASNALGVAYGANAAFVTIHALPYAELFDGVTPPALPVGWTTVRSGAQSNWVVLAAGADTPPNCAFAPDVPAVGAAELISPPVFISSDVAQLSFRAEFNLEAGFDGMALELKLGTNAFLDVLTAGGEFVAGGYNTNLPVNGTSPLKGRAVWSGLSGGDASAPAYITIVVNLPASANGQVMQLRWVLGCDNSGVAPGDAGARVDTVAIAVPPAVAPAVVTLPAGGLTATGAVLNASVNPNRAPTTTWFEWGATTNYGQATAAVALAPGSFAVAVSNTITGLSLGATYHFRGVASNSLGIVYGGNESFVIAPLIPSVNTLAASNVTSTSAGLNAAVNPNGATAAAWFEYGLTTNYGSVTPAVPLGAGVGALNFSGTVTGLAIGTLHHYRAVATNGIGTGYGANQTFTTVAAFTNAGASLAGANSGNAAWGDFDNDGDLDVVTLGQSGATGLTRVYRNAGGVFSLETNAVLPGLLHGTAAWADFNNDGALDLALTGTTNGFASGAITRLYRNAGGGVFAWTTNAVLPGLYFSALAWGDFDNDGDLDLVLTGTTNGSASGARTEWHRNEGGGAFSSVAAALPGVFSGAVAAGDFDNDNRLDLLLAGSPPAAISAIPITRVYQNTGAGFALASNAILPGVAFGAAAWGDADNDGDLDLLLAGTTNSLASGAIARLYRNQGDGTFTNLNAGLPGVFGTTSGGNCAVAWGDYDADGVPDVALAGSTNGAASGALARLYRNAGGGALSPLNAGLPGVVQASAAWGDADDDGRLDLLLTGLSSTGRVAGIFRNTQPATNAAPAAPSGMSVVVNNNSAMLSWAAGSDVQTAAAGLTYGLRLGSAPGGSDLGATHADPATGRRRLPQSGGLQHGLSALLTNLGLGTYHWSVQAVDAAFAGSAFAAEGSFAIVVASPEVMTGPVSGLDTNRATLNGIANPSGAATLAWFELGASAALGTVLAPMSIGSGTSDVPLAIEATGLAAGTTWFYRLAASNQVGVVFGDTRSFTTVDRPAVVTLPATSLTGTSAVLNVTVNANQSPTAAWFEWGADTNYGNVTTVVDAGIGSTNVSLALTGLNAGVVYHFRAVATNAAGLGLGADRTFVVQTLPFAEDFDAVAAPALPDGWTAAATGAGTVWAVTTHAPDSAPHAAFTTNAAAVGTAELVTPGIRINSESTLLTFRQRFNLEAGFDGLVLEIKIGSGAFTDIITAGGLFTGGGYNTNLVVTGANPLRGRAAWSGLSGGTTGTPAFLTTSVYLPPGANSNIVQLRWLVGTDGSAVAPGVAGAAIDNVAITVPAPAAPAAVTLAATLLTPASATLNATVNPNGSATLAWFQWGATTNYGSATAALALGGGPAAIAVSNLLSGLAAGSTYHYRAAASNVVGLAFGDDQVFQTSPRPAISGVTIQSNGLFRFQFTGSPDASYSVLATTNVGTPPAAWTLIGAATNAGGGLFQFVDPASTNLTRRFYQLRSP